jgi:hypothetical protein
VIDVFGRDPRPMGLPADRPVGDHLDRLDEQPIVVDAAGRFLGFLHPINLLGAAVHEAIEGGLSVAEAHQALTRTYVLDAPHPPSISLIRRL